MKRMTLSMGLVVAVALLVAGAASAHQAHTQSAISASPNPVTAGTDATITGTVTYTGTFGGGPSNGHSVSNGDPVVGENLQIQKAVDSFGNHVSCEDPALANFVTISQGATNGSGEYSIVFSTGTFTEDTRLGFRSHHPAGTGAGPGHGSGQSASDCLDLVILVASEGCSHGYWKNHTSEWPSPYTTSTTLGSVFSIPFSLAALGGDTFEDALDYTGGPTVEDAAKILLRNAVAALLNAAHSDVAFPMTEAEVLEAVNDALASGDRDTMLDLEEELDELVNLGCPLS